MANVNVIDLSTAGIKVCYAVETTAGTKPTAFTALPGMKSIPSLNPEPNLIQTTTLDATEWHTYIQGLKDIGGALSFTANLTEAFMTEWNALMSAYEAGKTSGLVTWVEIYIPDLAEAFFFIGEPSPLGMPEVAVDAVLEIQAFLAPNEIKGWETAVAPT